MNALQLPFQLTSEQLALQQQIMMTYPKISELIYKGFITQNDINTAYGFFLKVASIYTSTVSQILADDDLTTFIDNEPIPSLFKIQDSQYQTHLISVKGQAELDYRLAMLNILT